MRSVSVVLGVVVLLAACSIDGSGIGPSVNGGGDAFQNDGSGADGAGATGGTASGGRPGTGGVVSGTGGTPGAGGTPVTGTGGGPSTDAPVDAPGVDTTPPVALGNGALCSAGNWCVSGACVDGVCCEQACTSDCMACTGDRTGLIDGQCRPVKLGSDPDNECEEDGDVCGRTGRCANGACEVAANGKLCGDGSCSGYTFAPASRCNGAGQCVAPAEDSCPGMLKCANAKVCAGKCTSDNDCRTGTVCDLTDGTCKDGIAVGMACDPAMAGKDCESGNCVDGVCCDAACVGACRACTLAKTGQRTGHCAPIKVNTDPDEECATEDPSTCGKNGTCDGAGACKRYVDGTTCGTTCCDKGPGRGARPCNYICKAGTCDTENALPQSETCAGLSCCCPNGGGAGKAACVFPTACAGTCG